MSDTVLLVIDAQESFRQRYAFEDQNVVPYFAAQQALIDGAVAAGIPVVQVLHDDGDGPFAEATGFVRTLAELTLNPVAVFRKARHSALVGSGLDVWLIENGIRRIIVSGVRTEQCCETTTRHASDLGYAVDYVTEATLTFPMTGTDGRVYSPDEIKARTELVLVNRFARIATVNEALSGPLKAAA